MIYSRNMMKKELKKEVQKQLWRMGKKVRDMAGTPGIEYDLLVEGSIRVCIIQEDVDLNVMRKKCDVVAALIEGKKMYSFLSTKTIGWKRPGEIFGPKEE